LGKGHAGNAGNPRRGEIRREYSVTSRKKRGREEEHAVNGKKKRRRVKKS
jgi:hypothetical protein